MFTKVAEPKLFHGYLIDFQKSDSRKFNENQNNSKLTSGGCAA